MICRKMQSSLPKKKTHFIAFPILEDGPFQKITFSLTKMLFIQKKRMVEAKNPFFPLNESGMGKSF